VHLSLAWERTVTQQINGLMDRAVTEGNHLARNMLEWFINEQLEEMASMETLLGMVRRAGDQRLLLVESFLVREGRATNAATDADA
jgi:bacterioferritin B